MFPIVIFSFSLFAPYQLNHRPYQDILMKNVVVARGHGPTCESRYEAIKKVLKKIDFKRPITVLDIGAASGYFSFRIAHDFDATCVMISDPKYDDVDLPKLCEFNKDVGNVILLNKRISADELVALSEHEHFDVVLALNVLHHFRPSQCKKAAQAILNMADYVIIETPPVEDKRTCGQMNLNVVTEFVQAHNHEIITKTKRHTSDYFSKMYLLCGNKRVKTKSHGISFSTFKSLAGVYPSGEMFERLFGGI